MYFGPTSAATLRNNVPTNYPTNKIITNMTEVIPLKKRMVDANAAAGVSPVHVLPSKKRTPEQSRALRLAQNRKAARESRRRKKALVEDLQRSVIFIGRANGALKQQNDELARRLLEAHSVLSQMGQPIPAMKPKVEKVVVAPLEATTTATGEALAAAANTAMANIKPRPTALPLPNMQPGATMQAMADFQQAAAIAMQAAEQGMKASVGLLPQPSTGARGAAPGMTAV
mmetsp:Transcript_15939/g.39067  ORF Transcript_15939/g.39067 Transcript_15939/m.39067 type:complete len:229 (-) Transcript_15939:90-776(-)